MVKFHVLASGSDANAYVLRIGDTRILIDAGLSAAQTEKRLAAIGEHFRDIAGVAITHSHGDHTAGLEVLTKLYHKTIYATPGTVSEMDGKLRRFAPRYQEIPQDGLFRIGCIDAYAFPVQHDSAEPCGFIFQGEGLRIGVATDLGTITTDVLNVFPSCDLIFTESNHDPATLEVGPYPPFLKDRVLKQHLSNEQTCGFVRDHLTNKTSTLILGHISSNNNDPRLARIMAQKALGSRSTNLLIAAPGQTLHPVLY